MSVKVNVVNSCLERIKRCVMNRNKVLILVVLYKATLQESSTIRCLKTYLKDSQFPYKVLVYNNYPEIEICSDDAYDCEIVNAERNEFLVGPYNFAWKKAISEGYDWLLLFDQDSAPTMEYFTELGEKLNCVDAKTAAIVPLIDSEGTRVSPFVFSKNIGPFGLKPETRENLVLKSDEYLSAINSCACMRVEAISSINGFSQEFPLDYLDLWIFLEFYKKGYTVVTMSVKVQHSLSIAKKSFRPMGVPRYVSYMKARARFARMLSKSAIFRFKFLSLGVAVKLLGRPSEWSFLIPTLKALFY